METTQRSARNRMLFFSVLWAVLYILCLLIVKKMELSKTVGIILSFIPTITFVLFIYNYIRNINFMDEVQRRIQLEATVWGFSLGILLLMTLGLLDHVITLNKNDWGATNLIPFFFIFYFIGIFISRRKYS